VRCFLDQVTTLAGSGTIGFAGGFGVDAQFGFPGGVAVDGAGNMYVADTNNNQIRKITAAGEVTTLAGTGVAGFNNGPVAAAQFRNPGGVAVDGAGNVYVADTSNDRIRKITAAGEVSTLAGSGTFGFVDGFGVNARFGAPGGVAVDGAGNVYVADSGNNRIRKITAAGQVTTLAGDGTAGFADTAPSVAARFSFPGGVAVDGAGNVYVADTANHSIRKITATGQVTTLAGNGTTAGIVNGTGVNARFNNPYGVAVDGAGNVYVADASNRRIRKIR